MLNPSNIGEIYTKNDIVNVVHMLSSDVVNDITGKQINWLAT